MEGSTDTIIQIYSNARGLSAPSAISKPSMGMKTLPLILKQTPIPRIFVQMKTLDFWITPLMSQMVELGSCIVLNSEREKSE